MLPDFWLEPASVSSAISGSLLIAKNLCLCLLLRINRYLDQTVTADPVSPLHLVILGRARFNHALISNTAAQGFRNERTLRVSILRISAINVRYGSVGESKFKCCHIVVAVKAL